MVTSWLGALGDFTIVVFAPGSQFDLVITLDVEGCKNSSLNISTRMANGSAEMVPTKMTLLAHIQGC